mmetsp:Transcript_33468/g.105433  ORF Transcript_33468/g.105433 Transcript_33468/m.105433 type:complete len:244 (+) Transcript_33468:1698-2429(+)
MALNFASSSLDLRTSARRGEISTRDMPFCFNRVLILFSSSLYSSSSESVDEDEDVSDCSVPSSSLSSSYCRTRISASKFEPVLVKDNISVFMPSASSCFSSSLSSMSMVSNVTPLFVIALLSIDPALSLVAVSFLSFISTVFPLLAVPLVLRREAAVFFSSLSLASSSLALSSMFLCLRSALSFCTTNLTRCMRYVACILIAALRRRYLQAYKLRDLRILAPASNLTCREGTSCSIFARFSFW